jgi:hypothetical protein
MKQYFLKLSWQAPILASLTLGLAPFAPPHIVEKLQMLVHGELVKLIDWFDLLLHGAPWMLLFLKAYFELQRKREVNREAKSH